MNPTQSRILVLLACGLLVACSSSRDRKTDSGLSDAGLSDGGSDDGGPADGGSTDGGGTDAGDSDAGATDGGGVDASRPDAGACVDPPAGGSRPVAWECSPCRPPGPDGVTRGECSSDSECTAGDNGRCHWSRIGGTCSYDECFKDEDCDSGELCACDGGFGGGNACIRAGCSLDADCGAYDCSPTLGDCGHYFPPVGYFCHTPEDECYSDEECRDGYCAYDSVSGEWACSTAECVG